MQREIVMEVIWAEEVNVENLRIPIFAEEDEEVAEVKKILRKAGVREYTITYPYQGFFDVVAVQVPSRKQAEKIEKVIEEIKMWGE